MKIEHLIYFIEAAKYKSLHKVAEMYYTSHQVVRKAIKSLENELNVELIQTNNQGVTLTKAGEIVLEYAKSIKNMTDSLNQELEPYATMMPKTKKCIEFCMTPYLTDALFLDFIDEYQKKKKDVVINIKSLPIDEMYGQLTNEYSIFVIPTVDEAIENEKFKGKINEHNLTYFILKESPLYVCTYENTKWANLKYVSYDDFNNLPIYVSSTMTLGTRFLLNENMQIANSLVAQKSIIKKGLGVTLVTEREFEFYYGEGKRYLIIPTEIRPVSYICVHQKNIELPNYIRDFLDKLREVI